MLLSPSNMLLRLFLQIADPSILSSAELKETHLAPLTQPFTRSSSTSTIKGGGAAASPAAGDEDAAQTPTVATANPDGISTHFPMDFPIFDTKSLWRSLANAFSRDKGASESLVSPPVAPVRPGILIVTLHEGQGFSLSPHYQQIFNSYFQNNNPFGAMRPNSSSSSSAAGHAASFIRHGRPQSTSSGGINAAPTIHVAIRPSTYPTRSLTSRRTRFSSTPFQDRPRVLSGPVITPLSSSMSLARPN